MFIRFYWFNLTRFVFASGLDRLVLPAATSHQGKLKIKYKKMW